MMSVDVGGLQPSRQHHYQTPKPKSLAIYDFVGSEILFKHIGQKSMFGVFVESKLFAQQDRPLLCDECEESRSVYKAGPTLRSASLLPYEHNYDSLKKIAKLEYVCEHDCFLKMERMDMMYK